MALRPKLITGVITALAAGVSLCTASVALIPFAFRSPSAHVAIETSAAVIALVTAILTWGRFRQSRLLTDLALSFALATVAIVLLAFSAIPAAFGFDGAQRFSTWASLAGSVVSTVAFACAAFVADKPVARPVRAAAWLAALGTLTLVAMAVAIGLTENRLPVGIDPSLEPHGADVTAGHPTIVGAQLFLALLLCAAAVGFMRRAEEGEEFYVWVAAAAIAGAFGRVDYALFPSLYSDWVYTGDFLRLAFYLLLLVAVIREIAAYQARLAATAALEERRRLARDYHDGLAQELAFIVARLQVATREHASLEPLRAAAERAMRECRLAINALTVGGAQELSSAVAKAAEEIAAREGTTLELDIAPGVNVPYQSREVFLRVAGEAVTNAARHGHAQTIHVELKNSNGTLLRIRDDGVGFDPVTVGSSRFGLISMRERMRSIGGELHVSSRPGAGTLVEARVP